MSQQPAIQSTALVFVKQAVESFLSKRIQDGSHPLPPIALAYSGGADSTVLLNVCHALASQFDLNIHVVHVNHGLQKPADDWEAQCKRLAQQFNLPFQALKVRVDLQSGDGLEAAARQARYEAIAQWMQAHNLSELWTAHHADDQIETVLLQLFRGSGFRGLTGMSPISPWPVRTHLHPSLRLVRPLLNIRRKVIDEVVQQCSFDYVTDPSNQDDSLRRNWVRNNLMPELKSRFPQVEASIHRLSEFFQTHFQEMDRHTQEVLLQVISPGGQLNLIDFRPLRPDLRLEVLRAWLGAQGVRCGSDKLIELNRQLDLPQGGMRQVAKAWFVHVQKQQARVQTGSDLNSIEDQSF